MYFQQFVREDLGCASYLIGSTETGAGVVVDPQWDVAVYLDAARSQGLRISHIIETHTHADHVSGHGKLAAATGAAIYVHEDAAPEYPHRSLRDGDVLQVGEVAIRVLHTPGHRPEHISLAVTDRSRSPEPDLVLTGDALFVGAVGRPDLAVEPGQGARDLFHSLHHKLLALPDAADLYPAHVAGSLCGRGMSSQPSSTIGAERRFNIALQTDDEATFVSDVTSNLPPQPPHFQRIVARNRGPLLTADPPVPALAPHDLLRLLDQGVQVLDTRAPKTFAAGPIPGAINVELYGGSFPTHAARAIHDAAPVVVVLARPEDQAPAVNGLLAVGLDHIAGVLEGGLEAWVTAGQPVATLPLTSPTHLHDALRSVVPPLVIDVRDEHEWAGGHISGALHIPYYQLPGRLDEVPLDRPVAVICAGGMRSSLAASLLQRAGYPAVQNVAGGMNLWEKAGLPMTRNAE
jgi:glyoxylase-like metal-dependent hydrolase (beta-lactamase superfamily II)/rhodanese-related sulfurtransferase